MDDIVASASPIAIPAESHSVGAPDYTNETDGNSLVFFCPLLLYVIYINNTITAANYFTTFQGSTLAEL
jgi:hypothetical protein